MTDHDVYSAFRAIVNNRNDKALNYAVNYAKAGLDMSGRALYVQCQYVVGNITNWRGQIAERSRNAIKQYIKEYKGRYGSEDDMEYERDPKHLDEITKELTIEFKGYIQQAEKDLTYLNDDLSRKKEPDLALILTYAKSYAHNMTLAKEIYDNCIVDREVRAVLIKSYKYLEKQWDELTIKARIWGRRK